MTARDAAPARKSQRATPKLQRWVDLLGTLLARRHALTFAQIAEHVPDYGDPDAKFDSRKRKFERDKDELRAFGIPLETVAPSDDAGEPGYRLRGDAFYLPYLALRDAAGRTAARGRPVRRYGYQALGELAFTPDELAAVAEAATRVRSLGDAQLAADAATALRKLAFDLPVDAVAPPPADGTLGEHAGEHAGRADAATLDVLGRALLERRRVAIDYHTIGRDETARRVVEPWGLFFQGGHWYLAARDPARGDGATGLRTFRVSRVRAAAPDPAARPGAYEVPADFRLREHARSKAAWELGDGGAEPTVVAFAGDTGVTHAALSMGEDADAEAAGVGLPPGAVVRRYAVRRREAFVRWLLAFAGEAWPVSPPETVAAYREALAAVAARYGGQRPADAEAAA